jgi:RNA polymerase sigma factor (sigma-70 family)
MDKKQLGKLLEDMHREAYLWSRQCCRYDDELAKEVLQIVYLKIFEGRAQYNEKSSFRTWLFSVIRYTAIDNLKATRAYSDLDEALVLALAEDHDEEDSMDYKDLLQKLPEKQAHVLLLAFYHGMTLEAISAVMDIGLGTVRTHYDRGKKRLKELIGKKKIQDYGR